MNKDDAQLMADEWIRLLLTHQQQLFTATTPTANRGSEQAMALTTLRKTLIEELQKQ